MFEGAIAEHVAVQSSFDLSHKLIQVLRPMWQQRLSALQALDLSGGLGRAI